jgi:hypothetical protein
VLANRLSQSGSSPGPTLAPTPWNSGFATLLAVQVPLVGGPYHSPRRPVRCTCSRALPAGPSGRRVRPQLNGPIDIARRRRRRAWVRRSKQQLNLLRCRRPAVAARRCRSARAETAASPSVRPASPVLAQMGRVLAQMGRVLAQMGPRHELLRQERDSIFRLRERAVARSIATRRTLLQHAWGFIGLRCSHATGPSERPLTPERTELNRLPGIHGTRHAGGDAWLPIPDAPRGLRAQAQSNPQQPVTVGEPATPTNRPQPARRSPPRCSRVLPGTHRYCRGGAGCLPQLQLLLLHGLLHLPKPSPLILARARTRRCRRRRRPIRRTSSPRRGHGRAGGRASVGEAVGDGRVRPQLRQQRLQP